ncbi:MAG: peptidoglycan DD-metalloendopeptidase family protein [Candidatus Marinimicrobia bacterium]|jgi:septal ring factor EnvC (AmiA/AmiB activator)|nr:peptidoglycan DD-metalloendopeptidase family protein [Candidatus Neomarinimicrobiota bacterium]MBT3631187.1 peptidoglycan DD-metalloendopeptidase family protein [Candidatus Neomarinimicrobiota bacterium]MBT3824695.1 peptidoglycan DD-metalloendopeptidase family protein [Candidatus Neomarinimicrobiota bacterium]MBT4131619.1 peptidoglycan DD-metalloendopeptidase family protein [Candidatus Neomarinimicrobiota bacterium]MBT4296088.1 peptidoglycan DD-metalloendopeptidase family protein [Candidatus
MQKAITILLSIFITFGLSYGQTEDLDKSIDSQSKKLKEIRKEIDRLNSRINKTQKDEKATLKQIQNLDKQIAMVTQLKKELQKERRLKESQINLLSETIQTTDQKILVMKERAARRAVRAYKLGQNRDIDLLLTSGDVHQALRRSAYLSAINEAEKITLNELQGMITSNRRDQNSLTKKLGEVKRNIREEEQAGRQISSQQKKKESQLKTLKRDRKSMQQQVKTKQAAAKKIQGMIQDFEKQKQEILRDLARHWGMTPEQAAQEFAKNKGKLSWPVQGTLVGRFGPHKNEKLGTVTSNPGIDIKAPKGKSVRAVMHGKVIAITWIPGFGNTIIVGHGDSYYTVYAHIDNIQVNMNGYVLKDQIIAQVSDTGSLDGARLHFEVWRGKDKVDPLKWLKR